jgi:hypothetical protein
MSGPAVALTAAWLVYRMTRSSQLGDPFSSTNERRLWLLALTVAIGGSASLWSGEFVRVWLVNRSAAADLVSSAVTFRFTPIIAGLGVATLASVWHTGVRLREDVEGMI